MALDLGVTIGFLIIFLVVLIGPFKIKTIEHNLEVFLFICGVLAMTISGLVEIPGVETGWRLDIIEEALTAPLHVGEILGVPTAIPVLNKNTYRRRYNIFIFRNHFYLY